MPLRVSSTTCSSSGGQNCIIQHVEAYSKLIIKQDFVLDLSVCTCLIQLYDGRDMYTIYYITNNYMFRPFSLAIFRLINKKL